MRRKKRIRAVAVWIAVLFAAYTVFVYFLVSACLVPSFMDRLNAFEDITRKCYGEQVQTEELKENRNQLLLETQEWLETVGRKKVQVETQDGYALVAEEFPVGEGENGRFCCMGIPVGRRRCTSLPTGITVRAIPCSCLIFAVRGRAKGISSAWAGRITMTVNSG